MPQFSFRWLVILLSFMSLGISAQTTLYPGDIIVFAMASNMGPCGVSPMADEVSFMCFQDIETGTEIDITDNGWEVENAGFWGDSEGTLRMTRTGGPIVRGTVITLQSQFIGGNWTYRTISPDNGWTFSNLNVPGGFFNVDSAGEQVFFMQGGTWDNQGGGANRSKYDGRLIWGSNTDGFWAANGTVNQSNIPPALLPCNFQEMSMGPGNNTAFIRFAGPTSSASHFEWIERIKWWPDWNAFGNCTEYLAWPNNYIGAAFVIDDDMSLDCWLCSGCSGYQDQLIFQVPEEGVYNVVYTNGIDTFEFNGITGLDGLPVIVNEDVNYWMVSVEKVGGCKVYSNFTSQAEMEAQYRDPGLHGELWVCPNTGVYLLFNFLEGTPEPGGVWHPPLAEDLWGNELYLANWGPGTYVYTQEYDPPHTCPYDTASVTVHWIDISNSIVEVSCDENGTHYDITDDRIVATITVLDQGGFGPTYEIVPYSGSIFPTTGTAGVPETFTFSPGSATASYMTVRIISENTTYCEFWLDIPIPGFCSDPCDPEMFTEITGPEDICVNNCQIEPGSMMIDISGGTAPYRMDFTLSAPNYPPWTFAYKGIVPSGEISICVDTVPAPVYDPVGGRLIIPAFLAGSELTFTLDEIYDFYDCHGAIGNNEYYLNIHPQPVIHTTNLLLCRDEALDIDLTEYDIFISLFDEVSWWDGNPILGGEQINSPTGANLENVVQLWAQVTDDYCTNQIQVPFTIFPKPDIDSVPPIHICRGNNLVLGAIVFNDAGNSAPTYSFHSALPPDSTNILDPMFYVPAASDTVYVLATAGMCYDTLPLDIVVEDYPDFILEGLPCDLLAGTYSVLFTSSADSIHASAGIVFNNPTGQDAINAIINNTNISIELINNTGLCKDTFQIVAPNCNCPTINQPIAASPGYSICEDESSPVMSVTIDPGLVANWYNVPSGGLSFLQNSLTFQPVVPVNATYYVEALDPLSACYSIRTPITMEVFSLPVLASAPDQVMCAGESIDLDALAPAVLNGVAGTGQWLKLPANLPVSGTVVPANGDTWQYVFISAQGNCEDRDTMTATVHPLPVIDIYDIVCDDQALVYNVLFTSTADNISVTTGNLVQVGSTDTFALQDIPFDTDIQFDLEITATGCTATVQLPAPDCSCPALLQATSHRICSDQGILDLSAFEGPGVNGTWQIVSTPPGVSPGILTGSSFDGINRDPGLYTLRFIRNVFLSNCVDSALFSLTLSTSPFADAGVSGSICAPDAFVLSGIAGGSNVQHTWTTSGTGTISNPGALSFTYTPTLADITNGSVSFSLISVDQSGFCPDASETITMTIDGSAYYILNAGTQVYCDTTDAWFDLDALISFGNTSGEWFYPDTVSAPVNGSSQINPSTLNPGSYTIFYASTNAVAPCENDTTAVSLLIQNCSCPSVAITIPGGSLCSASDALNLNSLVLTSEPGSWSIVSTPPGTKPAVINGTQFVTSGSDAGTYRIRFTLDQPVNGCPSWSETTITVIASPVVTAISTKCADDLQSWQAVITSTSPVVTSSLGTVVPLGGNQYQIGQIALMTSIQVTASSGGGLCTATIQITPPDCACTLSVSNLPSSVDVCPGDTYTLQGQVNDPKGNVTAFWVVDQDSVFQSSLIVSEPGSYEFVALDELGCRASQVVDVNYYAVMVPGISWVDITCPGDHDGMIVIQDMLGGTGPYFISVDGAPRVPIDAFPYFLEGLSVGTYHLQFFDAVNCMTEAEIDIHSASSETLSLGPDQAILVGDSIYINPILSFVPASYVWGGDADQLLQTNQLSQWIHPETDQYFELTATDDKGCVYTDDLKIRVLLTSAILVPNIFSPNGDGNNDILAPITDPSITEIQYFRVYSRWGELVYSAENFAPNQIGFGWDGRLHNEYMQPGVFTYILAAVNKRGATYTRYGDVTLVR